MDEDEAQTTSGTPNDPDPLRLSGDGVCCIGEKRRQDVISLFLVFGGRNRE